jgi:hypothetical protein
MRDYDSYVQERAKAGWCATSTGIYTHRRGSHKAIWIYMLAIKGGMYDRYEEKE